MGEEREGKQGGSRENVGLGEEGEGVGQGSKGRRCDYQGKEKEM